MRQLLVATADYQSEYINKLLTILEKHPTVVPAFFVPAVQVGAATITQRCLPLLPEGDAQVAECLKSLTTGVCEEAARAASAVSFSFERYAAYESIIAALVGSSSFLTMVLCGAPAEYTLGILEQALGWCGERADGGSLNDTTALLLLTYLSFSSTVHLRQCIIQSKLRQQALFLRRSRLLEGVASFFARVLARHGNDNLNAVLSNYLGEMMHSFVCKWKSLYRTNDVLLNSNVFSSDGKQQSLYGDNLAHTVFYCGNFCSYAFFKRLFEFLYAITKYNNFKNPNAYNGAVEYVSICIFERIFGIAFVQQFADPTAQAEVDWESFTPPSAKDSRRDWLNIGNMSVVELAYAVSDLIKSSGRGDFFKSAGKTRFVFLMVGVAARREA